MLHDRRGCEPVYDRGAGAARHQRMPEAGPQAGAPVPAGHGPVPSAPCASRWSPRSASPAPRRAVLPTSCDALARAPGRPGPRGRRVPADVSGPAATPRTSRPCRSRCPGGRSRERLGRRLLARRGRPAHRPGGRLPAAPRGPPSRASTAQGYYGDASGDYPRQRSPVHAPRSRGAGGDARRGRGPRTSSMGTIGKPGRPSCCCGSATGTTRSWRGGGPCSRCHNLAYHGWVPRGACLAAGPAR